MLEKDVVHKIRLYLQTEYGATVHKYHGSVYGEVGHPDLYGTLPSGRAYYFEVKLPRTVNDASPAQKRFLENEKLHGAITGVVDSIDAVDKLLSQPTR